MAGLGKKILSAFLEVTPAPKATEQNDSDHRAGNSAQEGPMQTNTASATGDTAHNTQAFRTGGQGAGTASQTESRFSEYFDKLFSETNIPGPDYYEFSKMIGAMQAIPDERSRFLAAYAGLCAQGVDKARLLSTADEYLRILETDAQHFHTTVDDAMQEKVQGKKVEQQEKNERIQALSREIADLQNQITALQREIKENEERIGASTGGYAAESARRVTRIKTDIEKINNYLQ